MPLHEAGKNPRRQSTSAIASLALPTVARPISLGVIYQMINQNFSTLFEFAGGTVNLPGRTIGNAISVTKMDTGVAEGPKISVFGVFHETKWVFRAVELIAASGFVKKEVFVFGPDILCSKDQALDREARAGNITAILRFRVAVGGTLGLVGGIGVAAIRGLGSIRASAPFPGNLVGIKVRGVVGGSIDAVDAAGPPDLEAKCYEAHCRRRHSGDHIWPHALADSTRQGTLISSRCPVISSSEEPAAEFRAAMQAGTRQYYDQTTTGTKIMKTSTQDKIEGKIHEVKGKVKEKVGKVTEDPKLEAEGRDEKVGGVVQKKIGQIKKVFEK